MIPTVLQRAMRSLLSTTAVRVNSRRALETSMEDPLDATVLGTTTIETAIHLITQIEVTIPLGLIIQEIKVAINMGRTTVFKTMARRTCPFISTTQV